MSVARICDGCEKAEVGPPYEGWLRIQFDDGVMKPSILDRDAWSAYQDSRVDMPYYHVCSWSCLAGLAMKHADLFAEKDARA